VQQDEPLRVLFVCLGNICRSPTAEGVMRALVREAGLEDEIELDSAGTGSWHVGSAPDERATATAAAHGIALEGAARRVRVGDLDDFDLIVAMDRANADDLRQIAADGDLDVPDPYYGEGDGFQRVLDLVQAACAGLLTRIRAGEIP
jgi:protein-tyrosine phosphatase